MRLAEDALRRGIACGKVYNIVDGGPPVGSFSFWFPLIRGKQFLSNTYLTHFRSDFSLSVVDRSKLIKTFMKLTTNIAFV